MNEKEEVIAILQLRVIAHPEDTNWLEAQLEDALADIIYGSQDDYLILKRVTDVGAVKVLEPGQGYVYNPSGPTGKTEEIVDEPTVEPTAAGEGEKTLEETLGETYVPLKGKQMVRAEKILHLAAASFTLEVMQLSICPQTGAVVGWIRTTEGPQLFSHVVTQDSVRFILG